MPSGPAYGPGHSATYFTQEAGMPLTGYSVPETLTDDAGNALKGVQVTVTGPNGYSGTATTDAVTGVLRLGPLDVADAQAYSDYTVTLGARSVTIPVFALVDISAGGGSLVTVDSDGTVSVNGTATELASDAQLTAEASARTAGDAASVATAAADVTSRALLKASNLSDLADPAVARTSLGLGTAATTASSAYDPAGSASAAVTTAAADVTARAALKANNLSDLASASTARTNLGLGTAATTNSTAYDAAGTAAGLVSTHEADTTSVHGIANTADVVLSTTIDNIVSLTQAEYDALGTKAATTLYVIT